MKQLELHQEDLGITSFTLLLTLASASAWHPLAKSLRISAPAYPARMDTACWVCMMSRTHLGGYTTRREPLSSISRGSSL